VNSQKPHFQGISSYGSGRDRRSWGFITKKFFLRSRFFEIKLASTKQYQCPGCPIALGPRRAGVRLRRALTSCSSAVIRAIRFTIMTVFVNTPIHFSKITYLELCKEMARTFSFSFNCQVTVKSGLEGRFAPPVGPPS
jgi:hypothetical protein